MGILWKDRVTNDNLLQTARIKNIHGTVDWTLDRRRRRFIGDALRLLLTRPVSVVARDGFEGSMSRPRPRPWPLTLEVKASDQK